MYVHCNFRVRVVCPVGDPRVAAAGRVERLARVEKFHGGAKVRVGIFFVGLGPGS